LSVVASIKCRYRLIWASLLSLASLFSTRATLLSSLDKDFLAAFQPPLREPWAIFCFFFSDRHHVDSAIASDIEEGSKDRLWETRRNRQSKRIC
jgi:hypothetical protein